MKIAIMASLLAKWNMYVDACQAFYIIFRTDVLLSGYPGNKSNKFPHAAAVSTHLGAADGLAVF